MDEIWVVLRSEPSRETGLVSAWEREADALADADRLRREFEAICRSLERNHPQTLKGRQWSVPTFVVRSVEVGRPGRLFENLEGEVA